MQSEAETGLIYAQQRYYSPKLGRFLSRDPLGFSGGLHPYAYCDNDPHNRTPLSKKRARVNPLLEWIAQIRLRSELYLGKWIFSAQNVPARLPPAAS